MNDDVMNGIHFPWNLASTYCGKNDPLVEYIVLAEFDIDTGSTVRHQYPKTISSCKDDWLAEHMLPEGVHNRTEDWTYMFLEIGINQIWINENTLEIRQIRKVMTFSFTALTWCEINMMTVFVEARLLKRWLFFLVFRSLRYRNFH